MKIVLTKKIEAEQKRLGLDLRSSIEGAIAFVSWADLVDLSQVVITDLPQGRRRNEKGVRGSYFPKYTTRAAHIELYFDNVFGRIERPEDFRLMRPVWEVELAQTVFHEIGHHVREIRSHGIKASENEQFAEKYALKMMDKYYLAKRPSIDDCFDKLEQMALDGGADAGVVKSMRAGWEQDLEDSIKRKKS